MTCAAMRGVQGGPALCRRLHQNLVDLKMNMIIRTSFDAVTHSIPFRSQTEKKGKALAISHVVRVEEIRINGICESIRSSVIRQTSISEPPYRVSLQLTSERHVTSVSCNCVAQAAGKCKHVYALIYFINSDRSTSKTSLEQEWGKPTANQLGKDLYSKPLVITDHSKTKSSHAEQEIPPYPVKYADIASQPCALGFVLCETEKSEGQRAAKGVLAECFENAIANSIKKQCEACMLYLLKLSKGTKFYFSNSTETRDKQLLQYYRQNILLDELAIVKLCAKTKDQSQSNAWFIERQKRLSESSKAHDIKSRKTRTMESLLQSYFDFKQLQGKAKRAVEYGRKHEAIAISEYEKAYGVKVVQVGLVVLHSQPWLCTSPDGIVTGNDKIIYVIFGDGCQVY